MIVWRDVAGMFLMWAVYWHGGPASSQVVGGTWWLLGSVIGYVALSRSQYATRLAGSAVLSSALMALALILELYHPLTVGLIWVAAGLERVVDRCGGPALFPYAEVRYESFVSLDLVTSWAVGTGVVGLAGRTRRVYLLSCAAGVFAMMIGLTFPLIETLLYDESRVVAAGLRESVCHGTNVWIGYLAVAGSACVGHVVWQEQPPGLATAGGPESRNR